MHVAFKPETSVSLIRKCDPNSRSQGNVIWQNLFITFFLRIQQSITHNIQKFTALCETRSFSTRIRHWFLFKVEYNLLSPTTFFLTYMLILFFV